GARGYRRRQETRAGCLAPAVEPRRQRVAPAVRGVDDPGAPALPSHQSTREGSSAILSAQLLALGSRRLSSFHALQAASMMFCGILVVLGKFFVSSSASFFLICLLILSAMRNSQKYASRGSSGRTRQGLSSPVGG